MDRSTLLQYFGVFASLIVLYKVLIFLSLYLIPSRLSRYHHGKSGTTWALVTGASDGIGRSFVDHLLAQGFNVLMHGRNPDKLAAIQKTLAERHPYLSIRTTMADASEADTKGIDNIVAAVNDLPGPLTIVINNVGGLPPGPEYQTLDNDSISFIDNTINMNLRFPSRLMRTLIPVLRRNTPALIMNIGSAAGEVGIPFNVTYSGSKAYNMAFSKALAREMKARQVDIEVLGILVGMVVSAGNVAAKEDIFTCSSHTIASESLNRVGCGEYVVWGWWRHALQAMAVQSLPTWLATNIVVRIMNKQKHDTEKVRAKTA